MLYLWHLLYSIQFFLHCRYLALYAINISSYLVYFLWNLLLLWVILLQQPKTRKKMNVKLWLYLEAGHPEQESCTCLLFFPLLSHAHLNLMGILGQDMGLNTSCEPDKYILLFWGGGGGGVKREISGERWQISGFQSSIGMSRILTPYFLHCVSSPRWLLFTNGHKNAKSLGFCSYLIERAQQKSITKTIWYYTAEAAYPIDIISR